MKTIGIKLADGTFYPVLEEGEPKKRMLDLTTAKDNQTKVQIDLYRSETGSMDDAEYVDTLEVTKMVPHPNGEPELHLSLGLDENNNLTAEVVDPETGKKSETEVNLVSRTLAEKANPSDFAPTLKDTKADNSDDAAKNGLKSDNASEDFSFDDFADDTLAQEEEKNEEPSDFPDPIQDDPANLDPSLDDTTLAPEDLPEIKSDALEDMPFSFDDSEVFPPESSKAAEAPEQPPAVDELGIADNTLEGLNFGNDDDKTAAVPSGEESVPDVSDATEADSGTKDFDIPDFDDSEFSSPEISAEPSSASGAADSANATGIDFGDLPDFDDTEFSQDKKTPETTADDIDSAFDTSALDEFDTSDLDASLEKLGAASSPSNLETEKAGYTKGSAMDFSDLYDKETLNGEHASVYDDDEEKKKTKAPVIICVICAIICVIATILVLFVVPSKYNLIKSRNTRNSQKTEISEANPTPSVSKKSENSESAKPAEDSPVKIVENENPAENANIEEKAPAAEENKIVVAPEPEKVVPEPAPKPEKKPDVKYHIRWGDTLWDLSESYYKTPWKYPKIARYNNIKNPDLIISGTDILIPAE